VKIIAIILLKVWNSTMYTCKIENLYNARVKKQLLQIVTFKCEWKFRKVSTRLMVSCNCFVIKRTVLERSSLNESRSRHGTIRQLYVNEKIFLIMQTYGRLRIDLRLRNKIVTVAVKRRHCLPHSSTRASSARKRDRERSKQLFAFVSLFLSEQMHALWNYSGERFIQIKDRIDRYIWCRCYSIENQLRDCRIKIKWLAVMKLYLIKLTEINDNIRI